MTAPLHARDIRGKGRFYGSCGEDGCPFGDDLFMSVTNAQSVVAKPALVPAAVKVTAEAAWSWLPRMVATSRQRPDGPCAKARVAERCGHCRFCVTAQIKAHHKNEWESKADFGSLVHLYSHAHVLRQPMVPNEDVEPFIRQYLLFLEQWGVDIDRHVEAAETTILSRKHGYAGTGDIWLQLPTGTAGRRQLWLVDIKTSLTKPATAVYADQELQLAGLRYAEKAVLPDDTEVDVPKFAGAALLNLRATSHALIPLPAGRDAFKAFTAAVQLQGFFHGQDIKAWSPLDAPTLAPARKAS